MEVNRVSSQKLRSFAAAILHKQGVPQEDAAFVAEVLVEADLRGVDSHGVTRLAGYVSMIHKGVLNPRPSDPPSPRLGRDCRAGRRSRLWHAGSKAGHGHRN